MSSQDAIRSLQAAARAAAEQCTHQPAARVLIFDAAERLLVNVAVPAGSDPKGGRRDESEPEPSVPGWLVTERGAKFDGAPVSLTGRQLDVLRVLVNSEIATTEDLRAAWGGYRVEDSSIRWQVGELRKSLKKQFGDFPGELIESTGVGYQLLLR